MGEEPRYKNDSVAESSASLYTGAKWNLRDRVLGEVEKNSFIALPDRHSGPSALKNYGSQPGSIWWRFYNSGLNRHVQSMGSQSHDWATELTRSVCDQGLHSLTLISGSWAPILMSFSGEWLLELVVERLGSQTFPCMGKTHSRQSYQDLKVGT